MTFNIGVGLLLAVLINRRMPAILRYLFRTAYFFPTLVALVYCAIIWQFLYQKDTGIINYYLAKDAGGPVELYTYPGDDHNISRNLGTALSRSVAFFDKYVKNG